MRVNVFVIAMVLAATLSLPALAQETNPPGGHASGGSTIILYSGYPWTTGSTVGFVDVDSIATADLSTVNYVDVRVCDRGHIFAVDRISASGSAMGGTLVRVQGGAMTLTEVIAQLDRACRTGSIDDVSASLGANMALSTSAAVHTQADLGAHVFFMTSDESGMRRIVTTGRLHDVASAEQEEITGITHVRLHSGIAGHVFAVSSLPPAGRPIGETMVIVDGRTMTLAEASALLDAAHRGDRDVVLFTSGATSDAVVVGMASPSVIDLGSHIAFTGATHAYVLIDGRPRWVTISSPLTTYGTIVVIAEDDPYFSGNLFVEVIPRMEADRRL